MKNARAVKAEKVTVLVIGDSNVGKSTLIKYHRVGKFCDTVVPSAGIELNTFTHAINDKSVNIFVHDFPGLKTKKDLKNERFLIPRLETSAVIVFVYDKTHEGSFNRIIDIKQLVDENVKTLKKYFLVGNKLDDTNHVKIKTEEGQSRCTELKMDFFIETSAKEGTNVNELFSQVALHTDNTDEVTEREENKGWFTRMRKRLNCLIL